MFKFSERSERNLSGVHPDLVHLVRNVLKVSPHDFMITEGVRTRSMQHDYMRKGASQTLNSRHLTGHAIDFAVIVDGKVTWDWPYYEDVAAAFKSEATRLNIPIVWGGDWRSLKDGPHIELDRKVYR